MRIIHVPLSPPPPPPLSPFNGGGGYRTPTVEKADEHYFVVPSAGRIPLPD